MRGLNLYRMGESRRAVASLEHSLSLFTAMNETGRIPILLMETGMIHGAVGDVEAAQRSYQSALKLKQVEKDLYTEAEILNNLAVLYHQIGEYELASETFEAGLKCARRSHNRRAEPLILAGLADLYSEVEEYDTALQAYQQAESAVGKLSGRFITNYIIVTRGMLALVRGHLDEVAQILRTYRKKMRASQSAYERGLWTLLEGRYYLIKNEPKKAIPLLVECKQHFTQDGRDLELQWSIVWLAAAYEGATQRENARTEMRDLLSNGVTPDHALLVTLRQAGAWLKELQKDPLIGRSLSGVMEKTQRLNNRLPAVRRSLRHHAGFIQMPSATLSVRAFGNPEVSVNGQVIPISVWRTQSVRDLFYFFLQRQEAATKEQIGAILWPETRDAPALKERFKSEIFRLRRAVGRDIILFEDIYYRFNRALDYDYDVEQFDSHIVRARKASDSNTRIEYLQKAMDLVHGPYLMDVVSEWAIPERERLNQIYTSALEELAYLYVNGSQFERCLTTCQAAIQRDRFHEVIYQIEMRAHQALGDRSAIVRCYQACRAAMQDLGIPLSAETERIFRELTN